MNLKEMFFVSGTDGLHMDFSSEKEFKAFLENNHIDLDYEKEDRPFFLIKDNLFFFSSSVMDGRFMVNEEKRIKSSDRIEIIEIFDDFLIAVNRKTDDERFFVLRDNENAEGPKKTLKRVFIRQQQNGKNAFRYLSIKKKKVAYNKIQELFDKDDILED